MKINKIIAILALGALMVTSCNDDKFLEEKSYQHDSETFYTSQRAMEIGLAACYAEVQYVIYGCMRTTHSWMLMGCNLDTFTETSATGNVNWGSMGPNSGYARHWADYMYKLANRANTVIDGIDEHPEIVYKSEAYKNELRAEAVFMRAFAYRVLAGMYGGVVYNEHRTTEARYDYELISREAAWEKIAADFKWAEDNLPKTPRMKGTITKAAAAHYLAETYLALGKFSDAEKAATRVIDKTDGDYQIMTTRFGNRKEQMTDRYGNSLAAPQGAYWDLFRCSAKTNGDMKNGLYVTVNTTSEGNSNHSENKEAIWVCQSDFSNGDLWTEGGSGDSWWRTHNAPVEACWAPWYPMGGKTGTRKDKDGKTFYIFTTDAVCFPLGVTVDGDKAPDANVADAVGRRRAYETSTYIDSLACRAQGNGAQYGLTCIATEYIQRPYGDINGSVWNDPNDFRGSEVMIQRDPYGVAGKKWSQIKADIAARAAAHPGDDSYWPTASDTMNITPRFWKFSDDVHPFHDNPLGSDYTKYNVYDCDWYMIRIAETYLLRAEAYLGLNQKDKAADDINVVRGRAGAANVSASDVDIDYIMDERARELFGEEHRFITLSRLSCNPKATYVTAKYPTQNTTTTNYMYERVHKYGFGFEGAPGTREAYTDKMGKTRHYSNFKPHNYVFPIPIQIIQSNKDKEIPQNPGY
jgi:hypothetical protein